VQSETRSGSRQWRKPTNHRKQEDRSKPVRKKKTDQKSDETEVEIHVQLPPATWICYLDLLKKIYWLVVWNIWIIFPYILGTSSSQLTNSIIFQRGRAQPPTRQIWKTMIYPVKI